LAGSVQKRNKSVKINFFLSLDKCNYAMGVDGIMTSQGNSGLLNTVMSSYEHGNEMFFPQKTRVERPSASQIRLCYMGPIALDVLAQNSAITGIWDICVQ
jgi:hypothetical protein